MAEDIEITIDAVNWSGNQEEIETKLCFAKIMIGEIAFTDTQVTTILEYYLDRMRVPEQPKDDPEFGFDRGNNDQTPRMRS